MTLLRVGVGAKPYATKVASSSGRKDRGTPLSTFFARDDGDGFHAGDAHRLLRPLARLHSDAAFPGTGLGLASVARIVELHGGHIRAAGAKNPGATSYCTLPTAA